MGDYRITLYFKSDDPDAVFAYNLLSQMGRRKTRCVTRMLLAAAGEFHVEDIDNMTMKQFAQLKEKILWKIGASEEKQETGLSKGMRRDERTGASERKEQVVERADSFSLAQEWRETDPVGSGIKGMDAASVAPERERQGLVSADSENEQLGVASAGPKAEHQAGTRFVSSQERLPDISASLRREQLSAVPGSPEPELMAAGISAPTKPDTEDTTEEESGEYVNADLLSQLEAFYS